VAPLTRDDRHRVMAAGAAAPPILDASAILPRLIDSALDGRRDDELFGLVCDDLAARAMPILRGSISTEFLHPTLEFRVSRWVRGGGLESQTFARKPHGASDSEEWLRSPFYHLVMRQERTLRRRIDETSMAEFPVLTDFAAGGGTDYLALRQPIGSGVTIGKAREMFTSWVTDRPGGFRAEECALLQELQPYLVLAVGAVSNVWIARTLLETYLGRDAAERVLAGDIVRGRAETTRKVIWYSDLRDFTRLTDMLPQAEMLGLLDDYAEPVVDAITREGGEVLKFIGDGILAIFWSREPGAACTAALRAWDEAHAAIDAISRDRAARKAAITQPYLALHEGEVLYGNFGGRTRLDFTVLGPAVNEAARIAALCRSLDQSLIISEAFAEACSALSPRLVGLGRYALRGVGRPQMLWTLDRAAAA
jgi:adenylate cyclase